MAKETENNKKLTDEDLGKVAGGNKVDINNVDYTPTVPISDDTKDKIK